MKTVKAVGQGQSKISIGRSRVVTVVQDDSRGRVADLTVSKS